MGYIKGLVESHQTASRSNKVKCLLSILSLKAQNIEYREQIQRIGNLLVLSVSLCSGKYSERQGIAHPQVISNQFIERLIERHLVVFQHVLVLVVTNVAVDKVARRKCLS